MLKAGRHNTVNIAVNIGVQCSNACIPHIVYTTTGCCRTQKEAQTQSTEHKAMQCVHLTGRLTRTTCICFCAMSRVVSIHSRVRVYTFEMILPQRDNNIMVKVFRARHCGDEFHKMQYCNAHVKIARLNCAVWCSHATYIMLYLMQIPDSWYVSDTAPPTGSVHTRGANDNYGRCVSISQRRTRTFRKIRRKSR